MLWVQNGGRLVRGRFCGQHIKKHRSHHATITALLMLISGSGRSLLTDTPLRCCSSSSPHLSTTWSEQLTVDGAAVRNRQQQSSGKITASAAVSSIKQPQAASASIGNAGIFSRQRHGSSSRPTNDNSDPPCQTPRACHPARAVG